MNIQVGNSYELPEKTKVHLFTKKIYFCIFPKQANKKEYTEEHLESRDFQVANIKQSARLGNRADPNNRHFSKHFPLNCVY